MNNEFTEKLNKILPKITSEDFLESRGLGNEIAFYVFDYPAKEELTVRNHIEFIKDRIKKHYPDIKLLEINLFQVVVNYLKEKKILEKSFILEQEKGSVKLQKALEGPIKPATIIKYIVNKYNPNEYSFLLMTGIGNVWPLIRAHSILNNLQSVIDKRPLVLFYPGKYDGKSLQLFGEIKNKNYYRAFRLVD